MVSDALAAKIRNVKTEILNKFQIDKLKVSKQFDLRLQFSCFGH